MIWVAKLSHLNLLGKRLSKPIATTIIFASIIALCISSIQPATAVSDENSWVKKAPMHEARGGLGVAVVDGKIYAMGGRNTVGEHLATNEEYDPATDTWTFKAPLPVPMASFGVTVYQDKIYCINGENGVTAVYTPLTDKWETKASLPTPREGITACTVGDKIYVVGGKSNINSVYGPVADVWTTKAPVPVAPDLNEGWSCVSVVFDNEIHVIGAFPFSNSHQIYNPTTDSWHSGIPLVSGYWFASAAATTGVDSKMQICVFSGDRRWWDNGEIHFPTQSYNPKNESWLAGAPMPTGRLKAGVAVIDDLIYVIGGLTPWLGTNWNASPANEVYIPFGYGVSAPSFVSPTVPPTQLSTPMPSPEPPFIHGELVFIVGILAVIIIVIAVFGLKSRLRYRRK